MWVEISVLRVHRVKADARSFLLPEANLVLGHSSRTLLPQGYRLGAAGPEKKILQYRNWNQGKLFIVKTGPHSSMRDEAGIDQA